MSILSFEKPERVMPVEKWKGIAADGAPPGVYTSNMSEEDQEKWKAKLSGMKSGDHQITIRSTKPHANTVIIVNGKMPGSAAGRSFDPKPFEVKISANGPMRMSPVVLAEMQQAIAEARAILSLIEDAGMPSDVSKAVLAEIRAGQNPMANSSGDVR